MPYESLEPLPEAVSEKVSNAEQIFETVVEFLEILAKSDKSDAEKLQACKEQKEILDEIIGDLSDIKNTETGKNIIQNLKTSANDIAQIIEHLEAKLRNKETGSQEKIPLGKNFYVTPWREGYMFTPKSLKLRSSENYTINAVNAVKKPPQEEGGFILDFAPGIAGKNIGNIPAQAKNTEGLAKEITALYDSLESFEGDKNLEAIYLRLKLVSTQVEEIKNSRSNSANDFRKVRKINTELSELTSAISRLSFEKKGIIARAPIFSDSHKSHKIFLSLHLKELHVQMQPITQEVEKTERLKREAEKTKKAVITLDGKEVKNVPEDLAGYLLVKIGKNVFDWEKGGIRFSSSGQVLSFTTKERLPHSILNNLLMIPERYLSLPIAEKQFMNTAIGSKNIRQIGFLGGHIVSLTWDGIAQLKNALEVFPSGTHLEVFPKKGEDDPIDLTKMAPDAQRVYIGERFGKTAISVYEWVRNGYNTYSDGVMLPGSLEHFQETGNEQAAKRQYKKVNDKLALLSREFRVKGIVIWNEGEYRYNTILESLTNLREALYIFRKRNPEVYAGLENTRIVLQPKKSSDKDGDNFVIGKTNNSYETLIEINIENDPEDIAHILELSADNLIKRNKTLQYLSEISDILNIPVNIWSDRFNYNYEKLTKSSAQYLAQAIQTLNSNERNILRNKKIYFDSNGDTGIMSDQTGIYIDYEFSAETMAREIKRLLPQLKN